VSENAGKIEAEVAEYPLPDEAARDGIAEDDHKIPLWFNLTFAATIVFAVFYIPYYVLSGWSAAEQYQAEVERLEATFVSVRGEQPTENPYRDDAAALVAGKEVFTTTCVACHLPDASGLVGPSLIDPYWKYGNSDAELFETVAKGRPAGMPPWENQLGADEIWKVLAYLETLPRRSEPGIGAPDYTPPAPGS
jgi:cytochrome c oxidase cbb3-type subunit 3